MKKNTPENEKNYDAVGMEKERELTAEELEEVLGGVLFAEQVNTKVTATSALPQLKTRSGEDLNIQNTDNVTMSFVIGGKTYTTTVAASGLTFDSLTGDNQPR